MSNSNDKMQIIHTAASLRGEGRFDDAITFIEANMGKMDSDIKLNALMEAFYAAKEKGDVGLTTSYAVKIAVLDHDIPSIQAYLE